MLIFICGFKMKKKYLREASRPRTQPDRGLWIHCVSKIYDFHSYIEIISKVKHHPRGIEVKENHLRKAHHLERCLYC